MGNYNYYYNYEAEIYNHLPFPRLLLTHEKFRHLSAEAKILYGLLLERNATSVQNGWQDVDTRNYVYFPQQEVQDVFNVSHTTAKKIMDELDEKTSGIGLIERKRQGLGLPTKIYVLNFSTLVDPPNDTVPSAQAPLSQVN